MTEDLTKTVTEQVHPVSVAIVGTGDGRLPQQTVAVTPDHQPNIIVTFIGPATAIAIRFANAFLVSLSGLVSAGMVTNVIPASDFVHLVGKCAMLSVSIAGYGLIKDLVTVFGKLEGKYPLATGSV